MELFLGGGASMNILGTGLAPFQHESAVFITKLMRILHKPSIQILKKKKNKIPTDKNKVNFP